MKTTAVGLFALILTPAITQCFAQNLAPGGTNVTGDASIGTNTYVISERGPHHRVWTKTDFETTPNGKRIAQLRSYTELATGLNYRNQDGEWIESRTAIELQPKGAGAAALHGQHKVYFPSDSSGTINLFTPDGVQLQSRVLGIAYFDTATGTNVLIGELKQSQGELHSPNVVIYPNSFSGINADLRYTYRISGLEQDIILREQPPRPEDFGLNPKTTTLQVLTEFLNSPDPNILERKANLNKSRPDSSQYVDLDFGTMRIGQGAAFDMEATGIRDRVLVQKQYLELEGRKFLIEEVPLKEVQPNLAKLPLHAEFKRSKSSRLANIKRVLPKALNLQESHQPMQFAEGPGSGDGYVLDYFMIIDSGTNNFTFQADTTYLVNGFYVSGTATVEGGTVIKRGSSTGVSLELFNPPICKTGRYRPAVFTSRNDNTVGQTISGSNGNPQEGEGVNLILDSGDCSLSYMRMRFGFLTLYGPNVDIWNGQFLNNAIVEAAGSLQLHNVLLAGKGISFFLDSAYSQRSLIGEHVTFDGNYFAEYEYNIPTVIQLANSIINGFKDDGSGSFEFDPNNVYDLYDPYNPYYGNGGPGFESVGAGNYYLANNSVLKNVGTTSINATLANELKEMTTCAPLLRSHLTTTTATVLSPVSQRDTDTPDLGYHYDPIDYIAYDWTFTSSSLTLTNGVVVGYGTNFGINLGNSSSFLSEGSPTNMNKFVYVPAVQEQPLLNTALGVDPLKCNRAGGNAAPGNIRFTEFQGALGGVAPRYFYTFDGFDYSSLTLRDCLFSRGTVEIEARDNTTFTIENNIFESSPSSSCGYFYFYDYDGGKYFSFSLRNNLFFGGKVDFWNYDSASASFMTLSDNAFDSVDLHVLYPTYTAPTSFNHGYINTTPMPGSSGYINLSSFNWSIGPLGKYYQSSIDFLDQGSRNADVAGLYHYTTQISQVKEANSRVDIGFHYVAVNPDQSPIDTDADGLADYFEDSNGNGTYASGDLSNWQVFSTDGSGLSDGWEIRYFGHIGIDPNADPDSDGLINRQEYLLGLNPVVDQSAQSGSRRNYIYDRLDRLDNVTGNGQVDLTLDEEGNIKNVIP